MKTNKSRTRLRLPDAKMRSVVVYNKGNTTILSELKKVIRLDYVSPKSLDGSYVSLELFKKLRSRFKHEVCI